MVQPCARPTNLATLNRKRLAVDASIWIYQFLKAVRDKEGNALRNSHVVGFFRRICKLLWFGIQPVFVFDGGAPALKRATIQARARRREGRRDDAVKTAGKLLAVQMQRAVEEEQEKKRKAQDQDISVREEAALAEPLPDMSKVVYAGEMEMSTAERQKARQFRKQDQYHLPELNGSIADMGKPEDPRIMSVEELEEYARQFNNGEDINLYDFSKIDFDGEFFKSLPPADRYNILNAARLRSRLRMGLSKEQLDEMFPDRMAFSRFQIERVKERNHLTQRLMKEAGMTGLDLTIGVNGRVAGDKDREYILVKNEGAEGGWALGVVSKEKDAGEAHKPIDVDAVEIQYQSKEPEDEDEDADFEDVPIEGVNRLPRPSTSATADFMGPSEDFPLDDADDSLFVGGNTEGASGVVEEIEPSALHPEEEDDLNRAIAMSLQSQHGYGAEPEEDEDQETVAAPQWTQKPATEESRPVPAKRGSIIAHAVNNRANAAVSRQRDDKSSRSAAVGKDDDGSDSDEDMQAILAKSRKQRHQQPKPVFENKKNPFDGPLPFPKLNWRSSLFANKKNGTPKRDDAGSPPVPESSGIVDLPELPEFPDGGAGGGFEAQEDDKPRPLPPWMIDDATDIRHSVKQQQDLDRGINAEDRAEAEEDERRRKREMKDAMIEIGSSSEEEDEIEVIEKPPAEKLTVVQQEGRSHEQEDKVDLSNSPADGDVQNEPEKAPGSTNTQPLAGTVETSLVDLSRQSAESPEPTFEDVEAPATASAIIEGTEDGSKALASPEPEFEDVPPAPAATGAATTTATTTLVLENNDPSIAAAPAPPAADPVQQALGAGAGDVDPFADVEYDEFSDPEDEELMAQMAEEAEEHARFASELNQKSAQQNKDDYEKELRQLRNQQKKDRRDADEVTQVMVTECQALLRLFGIPYITAPMEAEAQCAELVTLGLVDGIVTDDSDIFLFGGTRVFKNMFNTNKFVECYISSDLEKELSLSREQLISLAQLLGSDYTEGLSGVGPVTAVEILSEFPGKKGLENFREWWMSVQSQTRPKEDDAFSKFRKKFRKSQGTKLFLPTSFPNAAVYDAYLHPEVDNDTQPFQWGVPDLEGLRRFLMATIGWSKERTDEVLVPVIKDMNKRDVEGTQSNITRFFDGSVGAGAKEAFAPRQRAQGSKRMLAAVDKLRSNVSGNDAGTNDNATGKRKRNTRNEVSTNEQPAEEDADPEDDAVVRTSKRAKGGRAKAS